MNIIKKFLVFLIFLGVIFGNTWVTDSSYTVNGATAQPAPTAIPTLPLKVQFYNGNLSPTTNTIVLRIRITNTGSTPLELSDIKIRFYFTINGEVSLNAWCDYCQAGCSNVTMAFGEMVPPRVGADHYLEIGFTSGAGTLPPGGSIEILIRITKSDWTNFIQTDDYSFNPTATTYVDWTKATGYISGILKWGAEP